MQFPEGLEDSPFNFCSLKWCQILTVKVKSKNYFQLTVFLLKSTPVDSRLQTSTTEVTLVYIVLVTYKGVSGEVGAEISVLLFNICYDCSSDDPR